MKYRILVADDEPLARDDVLYTLRDTLGAACDFLEAANGRQALAIAREMDPDMIVIDVQMPLLSGLDVMKALREEGWAGAFLIISGYSDFQYAQRAVRLGACDYLLKPIDADALRAAACGLLEKVASERERLRTEKRLRLENAFHCVAAGNDPPCDESDFPGKCAMALIQATRAASRESVLRLLFSDAPENLFAFPSAMHANRIVALAFAQNDENARLALMRRLERLPEGCFASIAWGASFAGAGRLLSQCGDALYARFSKKEGGLLRAESFARHVSDPCAPSKKQTEAAARLARAFSGEADLSGVECASLVCAAFLPLPATVTDSCAMQDAFQRMLEALPSEKRPVDALDLADDMEEVCRIVWRLLREARQPDPGDIRAIVTAVREYLDEHYGTPVTLREMAARFSVNQNYLSVAFKEHTGVNFIDYLVARRMDAAKRLLLESDMSVARIAGHTGWRSPSYFQRVFKKKEGVTPMEYREKGRG
jgi:two-component system response regulator YesN